jgi:hypothetical protein
VKENTSGVVKKNFSYSLRLLIIVSQVKGDLLELDCRKGEKHFVDNDQDYHLDFKWTQMK